MNATTAALRWLRGGSVGEHLEAITRMFGALLL
jgi:hypothetical protein